MNIDHQNDQYFSPMSFLAMRHDAKDIIQELNDSQATGSHKALQVQESVHKMQSNEER